ncbi:MAG: ABC transporter substrate-binding protein [Sulfurovum sp.]|nr:MAG: ABC transporter substrate-binding protein [Sulfurovum sp.]
MLKKILLILLLSVVSSHAIEEQNIQKVMDTKVRKVLLILKDKTLSQKQKEQKSIAVMKNVFDYHTMARISLGKKWKSLTKKEKKQFSIAFEKKIKYSYVDKLRLYNNQKVIIKDLKKIKQNRITLENHIIGNNETYKVIYLFYKKKNRNSWFIYDVHLEGVSIVQTYRKQFSEFLKTKSFKQLLKSL